MKNLYLMTEDQVETLASERTQSLKATDSLDSTYLRVLVTGAQSKLGPKKGKRPDTETQLTAFESVAVPYYAAVLRGVMTDDIALDATLDAAEVQQRTRERNRRAIFARTAKSTIVGWVREGGDIRAINVATVTKTELQRAVTAARSERGETVATRIGRAQAAILAAVAREGPDHARERLEAVIEALQEALDELPDNERHHESTTIRTRAGVPTFREPARVLNRGATA